MNPQNSDFTAGGSTAGGVTIDTDVVIVGAGPVGMIAALDLASRGVGVVLIERHPATSPALPKTNHLSARTMEILRRLGLAAAVRAVGLPDDYPNDVAFVTTMTGYELARLAIPCRNDRMAQTGYIDAGWPTSEPPHRCNQMYFEPVIRAAVQAASGITCLFETEATDVVEDVDQVTIKARDLRAGHPVDVQARYLIGCEGGRSMTRKAIGATFSGVGIISYNRMVLVRAPSLLGLLSHDPAWMTWFMAPDRHGSVHAIDGKELWCFTFTLPTGATDLDAIDPAAAIRSAVGADLDFEVVQQLDWVGRRLVSDIFGRGRAFTAGDASHIWIPMAGYGMNAGIADATNLTWKIAGVLQGWADPAIIETYGPERIPVTEQVSKYVAAVAAENYGHDIRKNPPPALYAPGLEGDAVRADAREFLIRANIAQFAPIGLNFGAAYAESPIVVPDGPAPAFELGHYTPSTVPGARTPHIALPDGTSLYDLLGDGFALIRLDPTIDVAPLRRAASASGVPLAIVDIVDTEGLYDHALVLSRPDQHIAWRGDALPADCTALLDRVRGALLRSQSPINPSAMMAAE